MGLGEFFRRRMSPCLLSAIWAIAGVGIGGVGCTQVTNETFRALPIQRVFVPVTELKLVSGLGTADILFVVDNSGSMGVHQENLKAALAQFAQAYLGSDNDICVGFLTTEEYLKRRSAYAGGMDQLADLVMRKKICTYTEDKEKVDISTLIAQFSQVVDMLGTAGSGDEKIYESLWYFLKSHEESDDVISKDKFFRPSSTRDKVIRYIITITDEEEQTGKLGDDGLIVTGSYSNDQDDCPLNAWQGYNWSVGKCPTYELWNPSGISNYVHDFFASLEPNGQAESDPEYGVVSVSIQDLSHLITLHDDRRGADNLLYDRCKRCEDVSDLSGSLSFKANITDSNYFDAFLERIGSTVITDRFYEMLIPYEPNLEEEFKLILVNGAGESQPIHSSHYQIDVNRILFERSFIETLGAGSVIHLEYTPLNLIPLGD